MKNLLLHKSYGLEGSHNEHFSVGKCGYVAYSGWGDIADCIVTYGFLDIRWVPSGYWKGVK